MRGNFGREMEYVAKRIQQVLLESVVCNVSVCFVCVNCSNSVCF